MTSVTVTTDTTEVTVAAPGPQGPGMAFAAQPEAPVTAQVNYLWLDTDAAPAGQGYIPEIEKGVALGVATLGADGKLLPEQSGTTAAFAVADKVLYVSKSGNDANSGLLPGLAKLTIQAAVDALDATAGGTVHIGNGEFQEAVTLFQGVRLVGQGCLPASGSTTKVKAPSVAANCITANTGPVFIENLSTQGYSTAWTGKGLDLDEAHHSRVLNWRHQNGNGWASSTTGGTGLDITNTEGALFMGIYMQECGTALHLGTEATENVFIDVRGAANYTDLLLDGNCGGNTFAHMKWAQGVTNGGYYVDIGGAGSNVFMVADFEETPANGATSKARLTSDFNHFIAGVSSPETTFEVSGDHNIFDGWRILKTVTDSGTGNLWRKTRLVGTSLDLTGATSAVIEGEVVESGTVSYGSALRGTNLTALRGLASHSTSVIAATFPRWVPIANGSCCISGQETVALVWLEAGQVVTNITFESKTTAAVTPTNWWFSLRTSARVLIATTADQTSTAWAANTRKTVALTAPYTVPTAGFYYVGIMVAAATVPSFAGSPSGFANTAALVMSGRDTTNTGKTTPATAQGTLAVLDGGFFFTPYVEIT